MKTTKLLFSFFVFIFMSSKLLFVRLLTKIVGMSYRMTLKVFPTELLLASHSQTHTIIDRQKDTKTKKQKIYFYIILLDILYPNICISGRRARRFKYFQFSKTSKMPKTAISTGLTPPIFSY